MKQSRYLDVGVFEFVTARARTVKQNKYLDVVDAEHEVSGVSRRV